MNNPLISVIVPLYNCEKFIKYALESVFKQNYSNMEVIVINDGSTDQSLEIVRGLNMNIRIISQDNKGPAAARNTGIKQAKGSIIAFLDSDDLWTDYHIESMLPYLSENSPYDTVRGQIKLVTIIDNEISEISEKFFIQESAAAGLYQTSVFDRVGLYDETMRQGEDTDWLVRFNENSGKEKQIKETVLLYRRHENNVTNSVDGIKKAMFDTIRKKLQRKRAGTKIFSNE